MKPKASPRQVETARHILEGRTPAEAMRLAGYGAGYIRSNAGSMVDSLRDRGLLPSEADVVAVKDQVVAILQGAAPDVAEQLARIATGRAGLQSDDEGGARVAVGPTYAEMIAAARLLFDRGLGPVPKRHELSLDDASAVLDELLAIAPSVLCDPAEAEALAEAWRDHLAKRKAGGA